MRSETEKAVVEGGGPWPSLSRAVVFDSSSSSPLAPGVDLSVEELSVLLRIPDVGVGQFPNPVRFTG